MNSSELGSLKLWARAIALLSDQQLHLFPYSLKHGGATLHFCVSKLYGRSTSLRPLAAFKDMQIICRRLAVDSCQLRFGKKGDRRNCQSSPAPTLCSSSGVVGL